MIVIVDYKAGNLTSVKLALEALGVEAQITADHEAIRAAERVIFPGVGTAGSATAHLAESGLGDVLREVVGKGVPFMGVCFGMQLLFDHTDEDGGCDCLGIVPGNVRHFEPRDPLVKIPHMGWNTVEIVGDHPILAGVDDGSEFYFVHSYYCMPTDPQGMVGATEYADARFTSIVSRGNVFATQFHPERSGRIGLKLYENFVRWDGC